MEQPIKRLLLAPVILFAILFLAIFLVFAMRFSSLSILLFFIIAFASPAIGMFVAGKVFPGDNITLRK